MNVLKVTIAMETQLAQTQVAVTFVPATERLQEMESIAWVSEDMQKLSSIKL